MTVNATRLTPEAIQEAWAAFRASQGDKAAVRALLEKSGLYEVLVHPETFPDTENIGVLCVHSKRHERTMRAGFIEGLLFGLYLAASGAIE